MVTWTEKLERFGNFRFFIKIWEFQIYEDTAGNWTWRCHLHKGHLFHVTWWLPVDLKCFWSQAQWFVRDPELSNRSRSEILVRGEKQKRLRIVSVYRERKSRLLWLFVSVQTERLTSSARGTCGFLVHNQESLYLMEASKGVAQGQEKLWIAKPGPRTSYATGPSTK